jgi:hypothetical protein
MNRVALSIIGASALAVLWSSELSAQTLGVGQKLPQSVPQTLQTGSITPENAPVPRIAMPPPEQMLGLIRTTIVAVNQANQTGNYTVLRDLGAPDFRNANDASRLAAIFQVLREQAIDFTPLLQIPPEVTDAPAIDAQGLFHLAGFFPTEPLRVNFDLSFQAEKGRWRPYTISVYLARVEAQLQAPVLTRQAVTQQQTGPSTTSQIKKTK